MTPNPLVSERQRIERIAEEYRSKGYDVLVEPSGPDLPPFLGNHRPDLIARRGDERLVIELKPSPSEAEPGRVRGLAEKIEREPGWKFVLIATTSAAHLADCRLTMIHQAKPAMAAVFGPGPYRGRMAV